MKSVTHELANFVVETRFQDLPVHVVHESKRILLDSLGCALAGNSVDKGKISIALARRLGGPAESTIVGGGGKVSCATAAFANAELIQAMDFDVLLNPPGHVSPCVISAPLSLSESVGASGKDLIVATAIAHEVATRLGVALGSRFGGAVEKGSKLVATRSTGVMSIIAGAAAAGKVLKLDAEKLSHALGIAGYLCPVPVRYKWAYTPPPTMIKHAPAGWMSQAEVTAVLLAESGFSGDTTVLDGEYGFWTFINSGNWKPDIFVEKLGDEWRFPAGIQYKRYPCCNLMSASALGLFCKIIEDNNLRTEDIEKVMVLGKTQVIDPIRTNRDIRDHIAASMSLPYVFAVAAHRIRVGADWQDWDAIKNPKILEFMKKVDFAGHPYYADENAKDAMGYSAAVSAVEVEANGRTFKEETTDFEVPRMKDEELIEKFRNNASRILTRDKMDRAVEGLLGLENLEDVRKLMVNLAL